MATIYVDSPPPKYSDQLREQLRQLPSNAKSYIKNTFPIINWLPKYNLIWLSGDLTAAITVGTLVIPQGLAFAKMAGLPAVFGLYTSFVGVILYPLFGTSKDMNIGVSAIISLMISQVMVKYVTAAQYISGEWTLADAAITLSLFSGFIILFIGLFRLGALFHFIAQPAVSGFIAGSSSTIVINQFSKIFGIPNINTSEAPYLVFGKTLINLHHSTVDAALGVSALVYLYGVKYLSQHLMRRYPQHNRLIFFFNTSRSIVVLVFSTLICFLVNHFDNSEKSPLSIIGDVPAGFNHMAVPTIKTDILTFFLSDLPGIVILLVMEHGATATSLGKISDYKIDMSQETLALGLSNVLGAFFCAYPSNGPIARSSVISKSGARTPMTHFFVGLIVIIAIYAFTPVFTFLSNAAFAAIIAHSVTDLISGPAVWKKYWELHPSELIVFSTAYIISLFARIDVAVYVPVVLSVVVQLYRSARPRYAVLGIMDSYPENADMSFSDEKQKSNMHTATDTIISLDNTMFFPVNHASLGQYTRRIDAGIICFQPQENLVFQNAAYVLDKLLDEIEKTTRRGKPPAEKMGDRPWNNTEPMSKSQEKALLQSIILDLSGVHQMDYSGIEELIDASVASERYSGQHVHWYIVTGNSPAVRKALLFGGFGNQRRSLKRPGSFLSDLRNGMQEDGHYPGVRGCRSYNRRSASTRMVGEKKTNNFDQLIVIEQVQTQENRTHNYMHLSISKKSTSQSNQDSSGTVSLENGQTNKELDEALTHDADRLCYCQTNPDVSDIQNIIDVQDRFPFFFKSLHDATRAALEEKENKDGYSLGTISVISDRDGTQS